MAGNEDTTAEESSEQVEVRRQKLAKLKEAGHRPYPNDFKPTHTITTILQTFSDATDEQLSAAPQDLAIAGRIMAIRRMGKASFFHIQDRGGRLQVYIQQNQAGEGAYALFRTLDIGDIAAVSGHLFRTRTRELTLEARQLRLLTKCLRPLPEKWHGLADVEARYRQRYLDLMVNPEVRQVFEKRSRIVRRLHNWLRAFIWTAQRQRQGAAGV